MQHPDEGKDTSKRHKGRIVSVRFNLRIGAWSGLERSEKLGLVLGSRTLFCKHWGTTKPLENKMERSGVCFAKTQGAAVCNID